MDLPGADLRYRVADIAVREAEIKEIVGRIYEGGLDRLNPASQS